MSTALLIGFGPAPSVQFGSAAAILIGSGAGATPANVILPINVLAVAGSTLFPPPVGGGAAGGFEHATATVRAASASDERTNRVSMIVLTRGTCVERTIRGAFAPRQSR